MLRDVKGIERAAGDELRARSQIRLQLLDLVHQRVDRRSAARTRLRQFVRHGDADPYQQCERAKNDSDLLYPCHGPPLRPSLLEEHLVIVATAVYGFRRPNANNSLSNGLIGGLEI